MSLKTRSNVPGHQESAYSRLLATHASFAPKKIVQNRPVLRDMGNRLQAIPKHISFKKNGALPDPKENRPKTGKPLTHTDRLQQAIPPPRVPVKKTTTVNGTSKENRKTSDRIVSISARSGIRRQDNIPVYITEKKAVTKPEKIVNVAARSPIRRQGVATKNIVNKRKPTIAVNKNTASVSKRRLERQERTKNVTSQASGVVGSSRNFENVTIIRGIKKQEIVPEHDETDRSGGVSSPENRTATDMDSELEVQEIALRNIALCDNKLTSEQLSKSYSHSRLEFSDPDENCRYDPKMVAEYASDIFYYLRSLEDKFAIQKQFLNGQIITPKMRMILVDWLIGVHSKFGLVLETLYLCVSIVDRYMQVNKEVKPDYFQLVGVTALLVASKYEERFIPSLEDFEDVCANTYSRQKILAMERDILKKLGFNLGCPLPLQFLRRYNKLAEARITHHALGKYVLELALMKYDLCHVAPSLQAAAACCLSMGILNEVEDLSTVWTPALAHHSGYEYSQLKEVVVILAELLVKIKTSRFQTIRKKYAATKYFAISTCPLLIGPLVKKLLEGKIGTTKI